MPDVNCLFLNPPHNQNLKYAHPILFEPKNEIFSQQQENLIQQLSHDWWRNHPMCDIRRYFMANKNRWKAIFNWAAKGLFFLKGSGGYTHSGYHKTLSATIACDRTSCDWLKHKLIQNIVLFWKTFVTPKKDYHF